MKVWWSEVLWGRTLTAPTIPGQSGQSFFIFILKNNRSIWNRHRPNNHWQHQISSLLASIMLSIIIFLASYFCQDSLKISAELNSIPELLDACPLSYWHAAKHKESSWSWSWGCQKLQFDNLNNDRLECQSSWSKVKVIGKSKSKSKSKRFAMKVKVDETCSRGTESGFSLPWWEGNGLDEAGFQSSLWGIPERRQSHQDHEMIRIWVISQHILGGGHLDKKIMNLVSSKVSWVSDAFQLLL